MDRYKFICNDETVNTYGFVVKTDGIDVSAFLKNPVMLWNHTRGVSGTDTDILPIGKWENVRKEAGQLTANAVFDEKDEFSAKVAEKVKNGFLSACSIGIRIVETDDNPANWIEGQTRPTVTRCQLREISVCDIPANQNAVTVALYDENGHTVNLSDIPGFSPEKGQNVALANLLGLSQSATPKEVFEAVKTLKTKAEEQAKKVISEMVGRAIQEQRLTEPQRNTYEKIGHAFGTDFLSDVLNDLQRPLRPMELIAQAQRERAKKTGIDKPKNQWTLEDYRRHDPETLETDPDLFHRLLDGEAADR